MAFKPRGEPWQLLDEEDEPIDPSPHPPDIGAQFARRNSTIVATTPSHYDRDGRVQDWLQKTVNDLQRKVPENEIDVFSDDDCQPQLSQGSPSQDPLQSFPSDSENLHQANSDIISFSSPPPQPFYQPLFPPESLDNDSIHSQQGSPRHRLKGAFFDPSRHQSAMLMATHPNIDILDHPQAITPLATRDAATLGRLSLLSSSSSSSTSSRARSQTGPGLEHSPKEPCSPVQQHVSQADSDAPTIDYDPAESVHSLTPPHNETVQSHVHDDEDEDDDLMVPPVIWEGLSFTVIPKKKEDPRDDDLDKLLLDDDDDSQVSIQGTQSLHAEKPKTIQSSIQDYLVSPRQEAIPEPSSQKQQQQQQQQQYDSLESLFSFHSSLSTAKSFSSAMSSNPLSPSQQPHQTHPASLSKSESSGSGCGRGVIGSHLNFSITSMSNTAPNSLSPASKDADEQSSHPKSAFVLRSKHRR
ncbi:hypothetical protein BX666DRAFT_1525313 [Dichotomocladium elegans]|nr:hypothetical protein BX666DRAFT_1525313 [Dichotomocladium elegans]